jgi:hypothetical protein
VLSSFEFPPSVSSLNEFASSGGNVDAVDVVTEVDHFDIVTDDLKTLRENILAAC